jgi:SAM-dependent methyltransferase
MCKLYQELASWWPLLSPPEDYADEVVFFRTVLDRANLAPSPSLLELGCGGGSNAFYFKHDFAHVTLTDVSPDMLAISRDLNPECEHLLGDMRTLRLGRTFDLIFIHDAIDYMTSLEALAQTLETAFIHCKPGGLALLLPDYVRETFEPSTDCGGSDSDTRSLRYLEWTYDPDANDTTYITDYVYLLRDGSQVTRVEHDQHICGLFSRAEWMRLLHDQGFQTQIIHDPYDRDVFVAHKPQH